MMAVKQQSISGHGVGRTSAGSACGGSLRASVCRPVVARLQAAQQRVEQQQRRGVLAASAAHGSAPVATQASKEVQEKDRGFIAEMRKVAMKLHTKDQAPKEGGKEAPAKPQAWTPTLKGYVRFLAESQAVYDALEAAVQDPSQPAYAPFRSTGLERSKALAADLAWFKQTHGLDAPVLAADGPGRSYAAKMLQLAKSDPPAFICHFYNFYFAHTAGGRMIGNKLAGMLLDGYNLKFYQWEGDVNAHLDGVRRSINQLAEAWTPEQKEHCLAETEDSFKMSGVILRCITESA